MAHQKPLQVISSREELIREGSKAYKEYIRWFVSATFVSHRLDVKDYVEAPPWHAAVQLETFGNILELFSSVVLNSCLPAIVLHPWKNKKRNSSCMNYDLS